MKRDGDLSSLTDGKLYRSTDMVRLGCNDCEGCSACCRGMGNSVVLDPYDVWRLTKGLGIHFAEMIGKQVMLSVVDGLILPSLNMENEKGACPFLNDEGRCSIHIFRPGICRLFPLGRYYHDGDFSYVLMTGECKKENRSKIKIEKWLGEPNLKAYEQFVMQWKQIQGRMREQLAKTADLEQQKQLSMSLLQKYYFTPYGTDFFAEFSAKA